MSKTIYVTFEYDAESRNYVYHCDDPNIVGGAATLEEAKQMAGEALGLILGGQWTLPDERKPVKAGYQLAAVG